MRTSTFSIRFFAILTFSGVLVFPALDRVRADGRNLSAQTSAPNGRDKNAAIGGVEKSAAVSSAEKKDPWKPEDIIYAEVVQPQTRISPDAKWLVWVKSTADKDKDARVSNLILSSLTENKEIQLTRGSDNNGQPQWSPDGQLVAFTSNRARFGAKPDTAPVQI